MSERSHDAYFTQLLALVASRSTCARRAVGAIIVSERQFVLATGYNGVPSGFLHCTDHPCPGALDPSGDTTRCEAVHAEQNALLQCHRLDLAHTLYTNVMPCFTCAKLIANTPIRRVVCAELYSDTGLSILERAKIKTLVWGEQ